MPGRYCIETLGCPKNQVDSDKLAGTLARRRHGRRRRRAEEADLVVVNTCAFIEDARQESIDTVLALADARRPGARLVVTGCMAERYGDELADALPEVDRVVGFGVPVTLGRVGASRAGARARPAQPAPPGGHRAVGLRQGGRGLRPHLRLLRHPQLPGPAALAARSSRSSPRSTQLGAPEIVLVAQDLASYGRDSGLGDGAIVPLVEAVAARVDAGAAAVPLPVRPHRRLVDAICATGVPYFDLSLQHVSKPLLRRMRRWGDGERFLERIDAIRGASPTPRSGRTSSSATPARPRTTTTQLLAFVEAAQLDWSTTYRPRGPARPSAPSRSRCPTRSR